MDQKNKLIDASVLHRIAVERYSGRTLEEIIKLLDAAAFDLEGKLMHGLLRVKERKALEELLRDLKASRHEVYTALRNRLEGDLVDYAQYEPEFMEGLFKGNAQAGHFFGRPTAKLLRELVTNAPMSGEYLKGWVEKLKADELFRVNQQIRIGITEGEGIDQIVRRIVGGRGQKGVLDGTKIRAHALVRTAYTSVMARTEMEWLVTNKETFPEYVWVSVLDERTTDICRERAGTIYKVADYEAGKAPVPPAHINCRSSVQGIPKGYNKDRLGGNLSFESWLKRQGEETQQSLLGPAGYRAWKAGRINLKSFTDPTGKKYTLKELRAADEEILRWVNGSE